MTYCVGLKIDQRARVHVRHAHQRRHRLDFDIPQDACLGRTGRAGDRAPDGRKPGNHASGGEPARRAIQSRRRTRADASRDAVDVPDGPTGRQHGEGGDCQHSPTTGQKADCYFNASFILGGQIRGTEPRLFMIYPEGNFIECSEDTPFFQIGETKYGKPIIVRAYDRAMSFAETAKLLHRLLQLDVEVQPLCRVAARSAVLREGQLRVGFQKRIGHGRPLLSHRFGWLVERA